MTYFTNKTFAFVRELAENNDRDWFKARQDRYDAEVREPALDFIEDFGKELRKVSKHFSADPRPVGGSLFRIQRDTRFSKDKTPYKTHVGIHFRHFATRDDVHAPGYYLHLEPGGRSFAGVGLWRPDTKNAYAIRAKIDDERTRWKRATRSKTFADTYALEGESLVRPPKGYDDDHPLLEDLKRKDFLATTKLKQSEITSADFLAEYTKTVRTAGPMMKFLCEAVGVPY
jgi:uncharacterized protein (TIGR02453 family)